MRIFFGNPLSCVSPIPIPDTAANVRVKLGIAPMTGEQPCMTTFRSADHRPTGKRR